MKQTYPAQKTELNTCVLYVWEEDGIWFGWTDFGGHVTRFKAETEEAAKLEAIRLAVGSDDSEAPTLPSWTL